MNYKDGFNLNMFQPAGEGTPSSSSMRVIIDDSTLMRKAVKDMKRIADVDRVTDVAVHSHTLHINAIGNKLYFEGRICPHLQFFSCP